MWIGLPREQLTAQPGGICEGTVPTASGASPDLVARPDRPMPGARPSITRTTGHAMANPIKTFMQNYEWVHLSLGLGGNVAFLAGSILFLPMFEQPHPNAGAIDMKWQTVGVWLFIVGAFFMFVGALGNLLVKIWRA